MRRKSGVFLLSMLLVACSSSEGTSSSSIIDNPQAFVPANVSINALNKTSLCCSSLADLNYLDVAANQDSFVVIDDSAQAIEFSSGKTFVKAFKLPNVANDLSITLEAVINDTAFIPSVALLNSQFEVVRVLPIERFTYRRAYLLKPDAIVGSFAVDRTRTQDSKEYESYMLIYTTEQALSGETEIIHPARAYAQANSLHDPKIPNPLIPHSTMGMVNLIVESKNSDSTGILSALDEPLFGGSTANTTVTDVGVATTAVVVASETKPSTTNANKASESVASSSNSLKKAMLPETEAFYNKLIEDMIKQGEIDKALKLVEEAEYAGSRSARNVFIDAIKNN